MALKKLTLKAMEELASYEEYLAAQKGAPATGEGLTYLNVIQGEDASVRSESSLYAKYDRGSATTSPYSVTKTILNYTGGEAWKTAGQWIQWDFEVPEDGFYHITVKGRQNYSRGSVSSRRLYIDGVTPFEEAKRVEFEYGSRIMYLQGSASSGKVNLKGIVTNYYTLDETDKAMKESVANKADIVKGVIKVD